MTTRWREQDDLQAMRRNPAAWHARRAAIRGGLSGRPRRERAVKAAKAVGLVVSAVEAVTKDGTTIRICATRRPQTHGTKCSMSRIRQYVHHWIDNRHGKAKGRYFFRRRGFKHHQQPSIGLPHTQFATARQVGH